MLSFMLGLINKTLLKSTTLVLMVGFVVSGCSKGIQFGLQPQTQQSLLSVTYNNEVDILLVVDDSTSMRIHQEALAEQIDDFANGLLQTKVNFRFAATTTDMRTPGIDFYGQRIPTEYGEFIGSPKVLSSTTPDLAQMLYDRVIVGEDSVKEEGLWAMRKSLQREASLGGTSEFHRRSALLVVIFLTNEDDQSLDPEVPLKDATGYSSTASYIQFLDKLKPKLPSGERGWISHFIGVRPNDQSCDIFNGYYPGYRYMDLVTASDGMSENICTGNLSAALANIRKRVIEYMTDYRLAVEPVVESIQVYINDTLVPQDTENGWTYLTEKKLIRFHGTAIPKIDARLRVHYDPVGIKE